MKESTIEMYVKQIQNDEISILQVPIIYISDVAKELGYDREKIYEILIKPYILS